MYGYRARIGYTSPPMLTEVFPYEFYRMAPPGVTLVVTTLAVVQMTAEELKDSLELSLRAAREMARAGVDLVVLGGTPVNLMRGFERVEELISATEQECGVPVTTGLTAEVHALRALGARRVAMAHPFGEAHVRFYDWLERAGFQMVGTRAAGYGAIDLGRIPADVPVQMARALAREHPDADTLYFPCPHWPVAGTVEALEHELQRNVVSSGQAILWEALRRCNISDPVPGYGRLLREH